MVLVKAFQSPLVFPRLVNSKKMHFITPRYALFIMR